MASPLNNRNSPLAQVKEGMDVYSGDNKIGTVRDFHFGEEGDGQAQSPADRANNIATNATARDIDPGNPTRVDTLVTEFANAFDDYDMNDTIRNRLMQHGFIRIDTGLLGSDKFAMADQVTSVSSDRVMLSVDEDELISR